jgi:hypothetical protein
MTVRVALTVAVTFALPAAVLAQATGAAKAPKPPASQLVVMPAGEMKWMDLDPGAPGVKVADLWGNHAAGAYGALFKLPAGFAVPLHTHTYDMKVVIVSGTYIQRRKASRSSGWDRGPTSCNPAEATATRRRVTRPPNVSSSSRARGRSTSSRSRRRRHRRSSRRPSRSAMATWSM